MEQIKKYAKLTAKEKIKKRLVSSVDISERDLVDENLFLGDSWEDGMKLIQNKFKHMK